MPAPDKAELEVLNDKNTIVIVPEEGAEHRIARKFLQMNAPKVITEQRMFSELVLGTLQTDITILVVTRDPSIATNTTFADVDGKLHHKSRGDEALLEEVRVSAPVKVSKYWVRDNPMRPGRPDVAGMLEALGKTTTPWRFDFVDKGEDKPQILKLTTM